MFGHRSGDACSGSPVGDLPPQRAHHSPLHPRVVKGRIKWLLAGSPSQAPLDLPFLNIVHFSKHHCKFALGLLGTMLLPPQKCHAGMHIVLDLLLSTKVSSKFILYFKF